MGEKSENTCKVHHPEAQAHLQTDLVPGIQDTGRPLPPLLTTSLQAYLQQFLLPNTSCRAIEKKFTRYTKRQKTQFEDTD